MLEAQSLLDDPLLAFSRQIGALLENRYGADFTIEVGAEKIKAHSLILGARSPIFKATCAQQRRVLINNLEPDAVHEMLHFMYNGKLREPLEANHQWKASQWQSILKLLEAAHVYQINDLVDICIEALTGDLTEDLAMQLHAEATNMGVQK